MHFLHFGLPAFALIAAVTAQGGNLTEAIDDLPSCALQCLIKYLPTSNCGFTNVNCICTNVPLQTTLSQCIQGSCKFVDQETVGEVNTKLCKGYPVQSRGRNFIILSLVFGSITLLTIALRCYSRYKVAAQLWWDDWMILAATAILCAVISNSVINCLKGFGKHFWNIDPKVVPSLLKIFWNSEMLYITVLMFTRLSILLFYLRVFRRRSFRVSVWVVMGLVAAGALAFNLVIIFQCNPIKAVWDLTIDNAKCVNINTFAYISAGIGIAEDFVILLLPVPELLALQMNTTKKLNVFGMFSLGIFASITSIIRLKFLAQLEHAIDSTWDNITPAAWSVVEINLSMICACLPSIRALLSRWFPRVFDISSNQASSDSNGRSGAKDAENSRTNNSEAPIQPSLGISSKGGNLGTEEMSTTELEDANWKDISVFHVQSVHGDPGSTDNLWQGKSVLRDPPSSDVSHVEGVHGPLGSTENLWQGKSVLRDSPSLDVSQNEDLRSPLQSLFSDDDRSAENAEMSDEVQFLDASRGKAQPTFLNSSRAIPISKF